MRIAGVQPAVRQFRGISETKMMICLVRLGRGVKTVVAPEGKKAAHRVEVVAA